MIRRAPERFLVISRSCESGARAESMSPCAPRTARGSADAAAGSAATISRIGRATRRNGYSRGFAAVAPPDLAGAPEIVVCAEFAQMASMIRSTLPAPAGSMLAPQAFGTEWPGCM